MNCLLGVRVAIAEDNEVSAEVLEQLLTSWGMNVTVVLSIEMLLEAIQDEGDFDVIISDYHLGIDNQTGLDLLQAAAIVQISVPILRILVTGDTTNDVLQMTQGSGIHLLYKPIRPNRLFTYLNVALKK